MFANIGRSAGQIQDTTPDPLPRAIAPNAQWAKSRSSAATVGDGRTMNANRLIEEWSAGPYSRGRRAKHVLWRMGQGETIILFMGSHLRLSLSKASTGIASRGLEGSLLICRDWSCRSAGRFRLQLERVRRVVSESHRRGRHQKFSFMVHDIGGLSVFDVIRRVPIELSRSRFSIRSSM